MAEFVNTALTGHRETKTYIEKDEEGNVVRQRQYKDVSYSFFANPMNGDVGKATDKGVESKVVIAFRLNNSTSKKATTQRKCSKIDLKMR